MAEENEKVNNKISPKLCSVVLVCVLLITGFVVGFIIPLRPDISEVEQRKLTSFPAVSANSLVKGDFYSDISLWYADSYPLREIMISGNSFLSSLYGIDTGISMIGNEMVADEIPDFADEVNAPASVVASAINEEKSISEDLIDDVITDEASEDDNVEGVENETIIDEDNVEEVSDNSADTEIYQVSSNVPMNPGQLPTTNGMDAEIMAYVVQNLYVKNGAAYSAYYFSLASANAYIAALNNAAAALDGTCNVISILVPNQSGAMLPYDEMVGMGGSNQIEAIHYYYSQYQNVITIDTIDTLRQHMDEYLYFRTDHHWTSLGAYYVYLNYCNTMGITPHDLSYFTEKTFEPFLGSFYSQLQDPMMAENPDYVKAYIPHGTNSLTYWDTAGNKIDWYVVSDVSGWNAYSKYCCFVGGDRPLAMIENPEITDGSACLVIKESYGNCFIPFLVDHYQTVYIMDYRYATENVINFVKEHNVKDLILINNITIIGATGVTNRIASLLTPI